MKNCAVKAEGCSKEFEPKVYWQVVCENPACRKIRKRRTTDRWHKKHAAKRKKYLSDYRAL